MSSVRIKTAMVLIVARPAARAPAIRHRKGRKAKRIRPVNSAARAGTPGMDSSRLPPVTCGYPVRGVVENHDHMRITSHNLWIGMWIEKMPRKDAVRVLRGAGLAQ